MRREPTRLIRVGGSTAVIVPPKIREALNVLIGDLILLTQVDDQVILSKFDPERVLPKREAQQLARGNMKPPAEVSHGR